MKPYEQFVGKMLRAVRDGQGKDPAALTGMIQEALGSAGLLQPQPAQAPARPAAPERTAFVDLNEAPAWARSQDGRGPDRAHDENAGKDAGGPGAAPFGGAMPAWDMQAMRGAMQDAMRGAMPGAMPGNFADLAEQLKRFQPGQGRADAARDLAREPGEFLHGSFTNDAGTRRYRLYVPARPGAGPRPLVVMLHGCKQNPEDFAAGTAMNVLAEEHGCLVLYPEQAAGANSQQCWNWFEAAHQGREAGEPSIIAGMTRQVLREHGGDENRVYVAGLSAGGAMAAVAAAAYPELYAAVGVHSGLPVGGAHDLMSALNAMKGARHGKGARRAALERQVPAIVFHGDQDGTVHGSNGEAVFHQFTHGAGLRAHEERGGAGGGRSHTRTLLRDDAGRTVAEYWVLHGAGHAWSGGSAAGSYTDQNGPDASAEMLRFFLSHARRS
ncbi:extracellular catalytic domain type 1 short-chain-length polyhydroxyalkanoate depolymerase [Massilia forsythiae]|nr:PHB depolymerase family esterase [Massilia forsythiae]